MKAIGNSRASGPFAQCLKRLFGALAALALNLPTATVQALEHSAPLSLTEAVRFALEHSPGLDSAQRQSAIASLQYRNGLAEFLPKLDLSATHGVRRTKLADQSLADNPYLSALGVALTETLYDNHESITRFRVASLNEDIARVNFEATRARLVRDVAASFYRFSLARGLAEVAESRQKILSRQFATVAEQYRHGAKTRKDFLRFKTQVQRAEIDLLTATNSTQIAVAELRRLLGVPVEATAARQAAATAFVPITAKPLDIGGLIPARSPALETVYESRVAGLQRRINELNETFARRNYWPRVAVTAGASYDNSGYLGRSSPGFSGTNSLTWGGQLTLTYNIWDWGTLRRNVEVAAHTRAVGDNDQTRVLLELRQNIDTLMLELRQLRENYRLNLELLRLSEQSYQFLSEEYRQGKVSYLDIINGLDDLLDARSRFLSSHFGLLQSLAQYHYYEGTVYERTLANN